MAQAAPKILSALMPVYNAENTLPQALNSLLYQRFQDFELVVVDDGSEDDSPSILRYYADRDPRVKPFFQGRKGIVDALNLGLANAEGRLIARMDSDDIAHPDRLGLQVDFLRWNPDVTVVSSLIRCFPRPRVREGFLTYESWLNGLCSPEDVARDIYIESPVAHPSTMIRRDALVSAGGYKDFGWPEDYDLWLRLNVSGSRFAKIPRVLLYWREDPGRLSRRHNRYSVENFLKAKAHYLRRGPLCSDPRVIIWGAGQIGRRISKHLQREGVEIVAFVDIDPRKIDRTRRGAPIISVGDLKQTRISNRNPLVLAAVPSRGARGLIRGQLGTMGLLEGKDFICVA